MATKRLCVFVSPSAALMYCTQTVNFKNSIKMLDSDLVLFVYISVYI